MYYNTHSVKGDMSMTFSRPIIIYVYRAYPTQQQAPAERHVGGRGIHVAPMGLIGLLGAYDL
jgi:hypothetical protein